MDDRTHILNLRDYVHHYYIIIIYYNKNKLCIVLFCFSYDYIKKNILRADIRELKTALLAFQISYISAHKTKETPNASSILHLYTVLSAGKLCEQAWNEQRIVWIIHSVDSCLRHYHVTLTQQSIGPNKFMLLWQKPQFMFEIIDYNNSEVFILLQIISRR